MGDGNDANVFMKDSIFFLHPFIFMLNIFLCDRTHSAKHFIIISRSPTPIASSFVFMSLKLLIKKKRYSKRIEGEYMNIQLNIHSVNERINKENRWSIFISLALKYIIFFVCECFFTSYSPRASPFAYRSANGILFPKRSFLFI